MVRVRVRNFQSVKDAEVVVDGLTVITGPNNSGKTAFMRAVKGVFTNAAPGPLVRKGEPYLSVEMEFSGGDTVLWEKGSEKPYGKGKSVNRYVVNGVGIENVGRGVPPEVEALGVREIRASSDRVWPQIAPQFSGTLFLVDRPGAAIAEALADVERVGKLTDALRLSERDRRSWGAELKVRRKDLDKARIHVESYQGLDEVRSQFQVLEKEHKHLGSVSRKVEVVKVLSSRLQEATVAYEPLAQYSQIEAPESQRVDKLRKGRDLVEGFRNRLGVCISEANLLEGFSEVGVPDERTPSQIQEKMRVAALAVSRIRGSQLSLQKEEESLKLHIKEYQEQVELVQELLGGRGECPVCDTVWEHSHD